MKLKVGDYVTCRVDFDDLDDDEKEMYTKIDGKIGIVKEILDDPDLIYN